MNCPKCGEKTRVRMSREIDGERVRLNVCECGNRFYTIEIIVSHSVGYDAQAKWSAERYRRLKGENQNQVSCTD